MEYRFYDELSRLIEADYNNGTSVLNYGYDVAGNLVDFDGTTRTFNEANQMTNDGTNTLTYDDNGNLTSNGSDTYTWDRANRLLSVGNHSYVYDGLGNRVQQTVSSVVTDYLNDLQPGLTKLLKQDNGTNVEQFVHAPRGIHAVDDGTDWNFYAQDGLGSVRALMNDAGVVQQSMSYDPYGMPLGTTPDNFGFTGEQTDANGAVFLRARYYEPQLGIFSALDSWEGISNRPMSLNGYSWVEGNVINAVDPSGMMPNGFRINTDISGLSSIIQSWTNAYEQLLTIPSLSFVKRMNSGMCDDGMRVGNVSKSDPRFYSLPPNGSDIQQSNPLPPPFPLHSDPKCNHPDIKNLSCDELEDAMNKIIDGAHGLFDRFAKLLEDSCAMYEIWAGLPIPNGYPKQGANCVGDWAGHIQQFNDRLKQLRKLATCHYRIGRQRFNDTGDSSQLCRNNSIYRRVSVWSKANVSTETMRPERYSILLQPEPIAVPYPLPELEPNPAIPGIGVLLQAMYEFISKRGVATGGGAGGGCFADRAVSLGSC